MTRSTTGARAFHTHDSGANTDRSWLGRRRRAHDDRMEPLTSAAVPSSHAWKLGDDRMETDAGRHRRRPKAHPRALRRTAQLAVFVVLGAGVGFLLAPLAAPSARADSQTGIDVLVDGEARHVELHSDQYDTGPTNYTLRSHDDQSKVTLSGVSIAQFIRLAGADASTTNLVQVRRSDGTSWVNLGHSDFADDSFREGPALFAEDAGRASFFRPVRDRDDLNAHDYVTAAAGTALLVRISS